MPARSHNVLCLCLAVILSGTLVAAGPAARPQPPADVVATVNGLPIPRSSFDRAFLKIAEHNVRFGPGTPLERMWQYRLDALLDAAEEQLLLKEARVHKLAVAPADLGRALDAKVSEQVRLVQDLGGDPETQFAKVCAQAGGPSHPKMAEAEFRRWLRTELAARAADDILLELTTARLKTKLTPLPRVAEGEVRAQFATVIPRRILVRRQPERDYDAATEKAKRRAEDLLKQVRQGADFTALAAAASDDETDRAKGGLREPVLLSRADPGWQAAVSPLKVGEVSEVIHVSLGFEIVKVEARGYDLPADYEKTLPKLRAELAAQQQEAAWQAHVKALRAQATVVPTDPELVAYKRLERDARAEAVPLLEQAARDPKRLGPAGAGSVLFQLAAYNSVQNRWADSASLYGECDREITKVLRLFPEARIATLFGMGFSYENLHLQLREREPARAADAAVKAVTHYQELARITDSPSYHDRLKLSYARLGRADLAAQEEAWLAASYKAAEERSKALEAQQQTK